MFTPNDFDKQPNFTEGLNLLLRSKTPLDPLSGFLSSVFFLRNTGLVCNFDKHHLGSSKILLYQQLVQFAQYLLTFCISYKCILSTVIFVILKAHVNNNIKLSTLSLMILLKLQTDKQLYYYVTN